MKSESGLVHNRSRRGKKRRYRLKLALRVVASMVLLGAAVALSAGIIHVVERPVAPFKVMAQPVPPVAPDSTPFAEAPFPELQPDN